MALINCPECKQQISETAINCPHCGFSIKPITIQQTSQIWKLLKLMAILMVIVGFMLNFQTHGSGLIGVISMLLIFVGIICFVVGVIGKWWNNK